MRFQIHPFRAKKRERSSLGNTLTRSERLIQKRLLLRVEWKCQRGLAGLAAHLVPAFAQGVYDFFGGEFGGQFGELILEEHQAKGVFESLSLRIGREALLQVEHPD